MMYTVKVIEDENGQLILPLPDEVLKHLGADIGDTIVWTDNNDGTFSLTRKEDNVKTT